MNGSATSRISAEFKASEKLVIRILWDAAENSQSASHWKTKRGCFALKFTFVLNLCKSLSMLLVKLKSKGFDS
jgi:hypothetical protein